MWAPLTPAAVRAHALRLGDPCFGAWLIVDGDAPESERRASLVWIASFDRGHGGDPRPFDVQRPGVGGASVTLPTRPLARPVTWLGEGMEWP